MTKCKFSSRQKEYLRLANKYWKTKTSLFYAITLTLHHCSYWDFSCGWCLCFFGFINLQAYYWELCHFFQCDNSHMETLYSKRQKNTRECKSIGTPKVVILLLGSYWGNNTFAAKLYFSAFFSWKSRQKRVLVSVPF